MAVDNNYSLDIVHCLELSNNDISHAGTFTIIRLTTSYGITLFVVRPEMDGFRSAALQAWFFRYLLVT